MAGHQAIAAVRGDGFELADLLHAHLGPGVDPPAHRHLAVDVLRQVRRVEGEHEPAAAHGLVEADHEALVARRVPGGEHGGDPRRYLTVTVGDAPVNARVVEVDPVDAVVLRAGRGGHPVVELGALDVHGHPPGEVLQPARVVVMQVTHGDRVNVAHVQAST